jgi:hypothetical protein
MKIIGMNILCLIFISVSLLIYAQTPRDTLKKNPSNAVFIEAGGNTYYCSLNYERIFFHHNMHQLGIRTGASPNGMPVLIDYFFGWNHHYLEVGAGVRLTEYVKGALRLMYRFQFSKGYYASIGFTPFILRLQPHFLYQPWAGIDIGYKF